VRMIDRPANPAPRLLFVLLSLAWAVGSIACASQTPDGEPTDAGGPSEPDRPSATTVALDAMNAIAADDAISAPRLVIERLHATLTAVLEDADALGYRGRYEALAPVIRELFDVRGMARATLLPGWRELSAEQQEEWVDLFWRFHVSAAAVQHRNDRGQRFRILGEETLPNGAVLVKAQLDFPGRNVDLFTDYRLAKREAGWRVIDIHEPPAVSDVAMRRSEYAAVLGRGGFDELVKLMNERLARRAED